MDKFLDFFKDIKERLSNPIFSSFIIAWLLFNWKIPIALFFYSNESLKLDGYTSYIDLIVTNYSVNNYFYRPIITALGYTFLFPFLRNGILAFQAWIKTWGSNLTLNIAKKGKIPTERYIILRETYLKQTQTLEKVLSDETSFVQENFDLRNKNMELISEKNQISNQLETWLQMNDSKILNGEYEYTFQTVSELTKKTYRVTIDKHRFDLYSDIAKNELLQAYTFQVFFCNPNTKRICFLLMPTSGKSKPVVHFLKFPNGLNELYGTEDHLNQITYKKV